MNYVASDKRLDQGNAFLSTTQRWQVWRWPSVTTARLILDCYIRSGWVLVEVALVLLLLAAFFFPYFGDVPYLYGTGGLGLSVIAVVGTTVIVRTSVGPRTALILARVTWRGSYSTGLIVASVLWRIPIYLLLLGIVLVSHHVIHPTPGSILGGNSDCCPTA